MLNKNKIFRHELKYYISNYEYEVLQKRLKVLMDQDANTQGNGSYHIRSLYFDDIYDSALNDKLSGVSKRKKYRIRIYNKSSKLIRLERKTKVDRYICKESGVLTRKQYEQIMHEDNGFLLYSNNEVFKEFYLEGKNNLLRPKVIVDYEREAYTFNISDVRITFDKMLSAGINSVDIFDNNLVTVNAFSEPVMIMEVKYNEFMPDNIKILLHIAGSENSAISKYVICRLKAGGQLI